MNRAEASCCPSVARFEIGVVEHDGRRLATELEIHWPQQATAGLTDLPAHACGSSKGHDVDAGVRY
jgi:hypothetical protein